MPTSKKWKTIRVFISSTFRDFQSERNYLVKFVLPRLREKLEPHRIEFIDIDLRWGVTQEQAENDQALIYIKWNRWDEAIKRLEEQEKICRELGLLNGLAYALINRALFLSKELNRHAKALPLAEEAVSIFHKVNPSMVQQAEQILDFVKSHLI